MWLIVGISGVTCGGKTTLANKLHKIIPNSQLICQDTYFWPVDCGKHVLIPELNHFNWELMSSLDMQRMFSDIQIVLSNWKCEFTSNVRVLIIEGFLIFNYKPISDLCNLKYFLTLPKDKCKARRSQRAYDPPDVPGYFEVCVWPEYEKNKSEIISDKSIQFIDGDQPFDDIFNRVFNEINLKSRNVEK